MVQGGLVLRSECSLKFNLRAGRTGLGSHCGLWLEFQIGIQCKTSWGETLVQPLLSRQHTLPGPQLLVCKMGVMMSLFSGAWDVCPGL